MTMIFLLTYTLELGMCFTYLEHVSYVCLRNARALRTEMIGKKQSKIADFGVLRILLESHSEGNCLKKFTFPAVSPFLRDVCQYFFHSATL